MAYICLEEVTKRYQLGETEIIANDKVSFDVEQGELVVILGASGAGKSTLLNLLGGMDKSDEGRISIDGVDIAGFTDWERTQYRRQDVGFVFQFYNLVPNLTAKENVELASEIVPNALDATTVLKAVGLAERLNNFPAQLSGGEQQRVSIARALAKRPKLLLCDEPTGALDSQTGQQILQLLQEMSHQEGATVLIVTHNQALAAMAGRVIVMKDGKVQRVTRQTAPLPIAQLDY